MRETADSQYLTSPLRTRCVDLRHGGECKPGQAGAAASKATVARTDKIIRADMEDHRRRALVLFAWYGNLDAEELECWLRERRERHLRTLLEIRA